jgi:hypothetical protein
MKRQKKPKPSIIYLLPISASYHCLGCAFEWIGKAGPVECPRCHHLYVRWLDFDQTKNSGALTPG